MSLKNIVLVLQFKGGGFSGWQRQRDRRTVQETLEMGLKRLTGRDLSVTGCSRTDTGVHARAMVASFKGPDMPLKAYIFGLNTMLPGDLKVQNAGFAPDDFSARFRTTGKTYCYRILNSKTPMPFLADRAWFLPKPIDAQAMDRAGRLLEGEHDFSAFRSANCDAPHSRRFIREIRVNRNRDLVEIWVTGNAFLTNMVRIIAGTLVAVGRGSRDGEWVRQALLSGDRSKAGQTAPPQGLTLERVYYAPEDLDIDFMFNDPLLKPVGEVIWRRRKPLKKH